MGGFGEALKRAIKNGNHSIPFSCNPQRGLHICDNRVAKLLKGILNQLYSHAKTEVKFRL